MTGWRPAYIYTLALVAMGAGWGLTQPLTKIAVSTGHQHFGLIFWQLVIGAAIAGTLTVLRGRGLPLGRSNLIVYVVIAILGTVVPNSASFQAIAHLPVGVHTIVLSLIPVMAFPMAIALGMERFHARRFIGLLLGLAGVLLLILPESSLPDPAMFIWILVSLIGPLCYAMEGNYVARWGTADMDPFQVLFGASLVGAVMALPLAIGTGQYISPFRVWAGPEWAFVASSAIHLAVYSTYVWLVGRAGAVFAAQVSYLVTGFGVLWAMLLLGERYSPFIWAALVFVLAGVWLVQPRTRDRLAEAEPIGDIAARSGDTGEQKT